MYKCKNECPRKVGTTCCIDCDERNGCESICEDVPFNCGESIQVEDEESTELVAFKETSLEICKAVAAIVEKKKELDEQEKKLKEQIKAAMEKHNVKLFTNDVLKLTYVEATTATSIDSAKLKKKYPAIASECSKISSKSAYVKITLKGDDSE